MSINLKVNYVDQDTGVHIEIPVIQVNTADTKSILENHVAEVGSDTNIQVLDRFETYIRNRFSAKDDADYAEDCLTRIEDLRRLSPKLLIFSS